VIAKLPKGAWHMTPTDNERRKNVVVAGYGKIIAKGQNPFKESVIVDAGSMVIKYNRRIQFYLLLSYATTTTTTIIFVLQVRACSGRGRWSGPARL